MPLAHGTHLGPYEILAPLGAGGMGEVYRARDTRLDRTVAVKVLASHLSDNAELRQRFEREARAVSSLNHPHICTLHDIGHQEGIDFLVMEYLEGETLAVRVAKGALPTDQVLRYGIEIADALDKAHHQGVVHRDLKPGNIMLTKSGSKLLDFGLAKLRGPETVAGGLSALPTQSPSLTGQGTILGTFQYMAPEQLEGKEADTRTDIFAFGALLYEMATGRKAFEGKSQASLISAIMASDPPSLSSLQPLAPPALERVIKTCLGKDPDERWQSAHDLTSELRWIAEGGSQAGIPAPVVARRKSRERRGWIVAAILVLPLVAALTLAVAHLREVPEEARTIRFFVSPPEKMTFRFFDLPVVSPDGQRIIFTGIGADGRDLLWVRPLDSVTAQALPGTEGVHFPFWSPDSRFIGFFAYGKLKKIEVSGGPAQTLCDAPGPAPGGSWSRDGIIVFTPGPGSPLYRVSASGGEAKPLTAHDKSRQEISHRWPYFLPDGRRFIYLARSAQQENSGVYMGSLDSKDTKHLLTTSFNAVYAPGYILFLREGTLMAQSFDAEALQFAGEPVPIAEQVVQLGTSGGGAFSVSGNGVLAYRSGMGTANSQLVWFDRGGKQVGPIGEPGDYSNPALSPDEKRLAVGRRDLQTRTRDIWVFDLTRGTSSRLTFDPADDLNPLWSPDGTRIMFTSDRKGQRDIYRKTASGAGEDELVLESKGDKSIEDWSSDGRFILYNSPSPDTAVDVWLLQLFGDRKPVRSLGTPFGELQAQLSPDGKWIAYTSNESRKDEVYVQNFPPSGGKWQISTAGGSEPRWRRDGKELFYIAGRTLMVVEVNSRAGTLEAGIPKPLFEMRLGPTGFRNRYLVTADGQRFLVNTPVEETISLPFTVVVNWATKLQK